MDDYEEKFYYLYIESLLENEDKGPKSRTVDFLRQFARVYHAEPALDTALGGYILS